MKRDRIILLLTHGYPLAIAMHLYFGDWCRMCQVLYNIIPLIVFGGLFYIWKEKGYIRLSKKEQFYLSYLIWNIFFIIGYYTICIFSLPEWVIDKNVQVVLFLIVTFLFYTLNYRDRK